MNRPTIPASRLALAALAIALAMLPAASHSQLAPEWSARVPVGTALGAGIAGIHVEPDGTSFVTGISGLSPNTDITTASFAADGTLRWAQVWDGPRGGGDQARDLAMGPGGVLWVVGNTPSPQSFSNVLVLAYDAATGALLDTIQYSSAPVSEYGGSIAVDGAGDLYVGGGTVGDGGDVMTLKFDASGTLVWRRTWDGPAASPFSGDTVEKVLLDPGGDLLVLMHGMMSSLQPDYVVVKYAAADGATLWEANWGVAGGDYPRDMEVDAAGDVYVTGIGIDTIDKMSTLKLSGLDGQLIWQFYDALGFDHRASGLVLDEVGGVLVTGTSDPDGDNSNFNDQFLTVKRDAASGVQLWTHVYGATCVGCWDSPSDVRVDSGGNAFITGTTSSPPYSNDLILFVLDNASGLEVERAVVFNAGSEIQYGGALRFDALFNLYDGGRIYDADTGEVTIGINKWTSLVDASQAIFSDGFESGDTSAWSESAP